jgi:hypothetical protein
MSSARSISETVAAMQAGLGRVARIGETHFLAGRIAFAAAHDRHHKQNRSHARSLRQAQCPPA